MKPTHDVRRWSHEIPPPNQKVLVIFCLVGEIGLACFFGLESTPTVLVVDIVEKGEPLHF